MADRFMGRKRREELGDGQDSDRSGTIHTEISIREECIRGDNWDTDIRRHEKQLRALGPMPNGAGTNECARQNSNPPVSGNSGGLSVSSDGNGGDSNGSEKELLFGVEVPKCTEQSDVPHRYWGTVEKTNTGVAEARVRDGDGILTAAEDFEVAFRKAIQVSIDTMDTELPDKDSENFARIFATRQSAASSIINSGLKADENRLRREKKEVLEALYERFKRTKGSVQN